MPPGLEPAFAPSGKEPLTVIEAKDFRDAKAQALLCHASQEECWKGLLAALQHTARWQESFHLAHSAAAPAERPEDDLFDGVIAKVVRSGRSAR